MNVDLGRDAAVVTALGGTRLKQVVVRCAVDDALLDGVAYGSGVVVEGTRSDGGIECRAIATGRRHLDPLCRAPGARDLLECQLLPDD